MQSSRVISKAAIIAFVLAVTVVGRAGRSEDQQSPKDQQDPEAVKIETTLVTVPVIASDRNGLYIPDMRQDEFTVFEDDVKQEVIFFATTKEPFKVILMLDTSASAKEKLGQIQRAAQAFVDELQPADLVKVISFDDDIRDLNDFTSDKATLRRAIEQTRQGKGTRLYDAMRLALKHLAYEKGRKAIVVFTDGVDWRSNSTRAEDNLRQLEEAGVIVYPIRYDTRAETEALVRQQDQQGRTADAGVIFGDPRKTTPPTVPGGSPTPGGRTDKDDPYKLPIPPIIVTQRNDPRDRRYPDDPHPEPRHRRDRPDPTDPFPRDKRNDPNDPAPFPHPRQPRNEPVSVMLDNLYEIADQYLNALASVSGGKLRRADTLVSLPVAFAEIAAELRTQYTLGYYPANSARDGKYRRIRVQTTRKDVAVRSRPGYRAPGGA